MIRVIFLLLVSCVAMAEDSTPFDFLAASREAMVLNNNAIMDSLAGSCTPATSENGDSVLSCSIKNEDYKAPIAKVEFDAGQIPPLIKSALPEQFIEDTKNKKVSCMFRFKLLNDNIRKQDLKKGDDVGLTHKMDVGVSCASEDGISTAFTYSTALFTKTDESTRKQNDKGVWSVKTKFNAENIFEILQDNINQGKVTYWKRGVGFINITDQKKWGLLQATGQQEWYHHMINNLDKEGTIQYQLEDGSKNKWGAFVVLAIGLQENRQFGDSCSIEYNADIGTRLSTLSGTSTLNLNLQAKASYHISEGSSVYLRAQSEATRRPGSTVVENTLAAGYLGKSGFVEVGVTKPNGIRKDVLDSKNVYTGESDRLIFVRVGKKF